MTRSYSMDLRKRVVRAVHEEGLSRRQAAEHFRIGISTAIAWLDRETTTGSAAPAKMGGYKRLAGFDSAASQKAEGSTGRQPRRAFMKLVPRRGLEPPHLAVHGPEPCASTNSAIWAWGVF